MKILYATGANAGAKIQLSRFLKAIGNSKHQIKIAAYKNSSPKNTNIDWTLDALLNIFRPELLSLNNDNLNIYYDQVKSFNPDLIISDLEYFTSYVANDLNIPLWQCSSSLINYALTHQEKYNLGLFKYHAYSLNRETMHNQRIINIIDNSDRNLVYSHYGDLEYSPQLQDKFNWVTPYSSTAKHYIPCQHNIVAALLTADKRIFNVLNKYPDTVAFIDGIQERYENIKIKEINLDEYYCNLKNSPIFVCQGQVSFLADAFYNEKYSFIYPDFDDTESILNSHLANKYKTGCIVSYSDKLTEDNIPENMSLPQVETTTFLHEYIEEL